MTKFAKAVIILEGHNGRIAKTVVIRKTGSVTTHPGPCCVV